MRMASKMVSIRSNKFLIQILVVGACLVSFYWQICDCLIITSVIAGNKKFKTVSFDHPWIKPLTFEKDLPFSTEFRRHQTVRAPKFDVDINVPIKLPLEDEYPYEEPKKPVVSDFFLETSEHKENNYDNYKQKSNNNYHNKPQYEQQQEQQQQYDSTKETKQYQPMTYADSNTNLQYVKLPATATINNNNIKRQQSITQQSIIPTSSSNNIRLQQQQHQVAIAGAIPSKISRSDDANSVQAQAFRNHMSILQLQQEQQQSQLLPATHRQATFDDNNQYDKLISKSAPQQQSTSNQNNLMAQESANNNYNYPTKNDYQQQQEFVPGGFINLQLSGPTGGPKMTHEDYDRLNWATQMSQTEHAMPFPILNYQQLQNFYGGLGTFTNGLPETRYQETSLLDKLKSSVTHFTDKLHIG